MDDQGQQGGRPPAGTAPAPAMGGTTRGAPLRRAATVTAVTFLALLVAAGLRSAPGLLLVPLQFHFGWSLASLSFTAAVGIFFYGLAGPFAASLMLSFGIRRTMIAGLVLMATGTFASLWMSREWHYLLSWGVVSGIGSGAVAPVLGAAVVNRWFAQRKGLVMGLLSASTATGALVFLPVLAWLTREGQWQPLVWVVGGACVALIPLALALVPERPADVGTVRYGERPARPRSPGAPRVSAGDTGTGDTGTGDTVAEKGGAEKARSLSALAVLARAVRVPTFWLLAGTFFVCGLTTNGLVGTHMVAFCGDHGIAAVAAAGLLSTMGFFDLIGTTASGWLTDRYDPRRLLCVYYGVRGLSLLALPFLDMGAFSLGLFAVFYGLDWVATVPPTVALTNRAFGEREAPIVFGWVVVGHQLGAATAAFGGGLIRQDWGSYAPAFWVAGAFAVLAGLAALKLPALRAEPGPGLAAA